jgi:hypothetical protein
VQPRRHHDETFHGAEHADGRRDDPVAVEERGPEEAEHQQGTPAAVGGLGLPDERHERQDAALAAVVSPHDEGEVLEGDHEDHRPDHQREDADHVLGGGIDAVLAAEALLEGVERAGTDVAVHHAQRAERECRGRGPAPPDGTVVPGVVCFAGGVSGRGR